MKTNEKYQEELEEICEEAQFYEENGDGESSLCVNSSKIVSWAVSQRTEDIQAIVEMCEKEREVPVEIPHGSPYLSGYNAAIDDIISSLKEKLSSDKTDYDKYSHTHCWNQQPPACGILLENHAQCCLCDTLK